MHTVLLRTNYPFLKFSNQTFLYGKKNKFKTIKSKLSFKTVLNYHTV